VRAMIALLVLLIAAPAFAGDRDLEIPVPASLLSPRMQPELRLALGEINDDALRRARGVRTAGLVLTLFGTVATIAGPCIGLLTSENGNGWIAMPTLNTLGALSLISGVAMWIAGQTRVNHLAAGHAYLTPNGVAF